MPNGVGARMDPRWWCGCDSQGRRSRRMRSFDALASLSQGGRKRLWLMAGYCCWCCCQSYGMYRHGIISASAGSVPGYGGFPPLVFPHGLAVICFSLELDGRRFTQAREMSRVLLSSNAAGTQSHRQQCPSSPSTSVFNDAHILERRGR